MFDRNNKHGRGKFSRSTNGEVYEGNFAENEMHGRGQLKYADGTIYDGLLEDGHMHDTHGMLRMPNGDEYIGGFVKSRYHGSGELTSFGGVPLYKGDFLNDKYHGVGTLHYDEGGMYEGKFACGVENGAGKWTRKDGSVVMGTWVKGFMKK
jgi:hypothetical protein